MKDKKTGYSVNESYFDELKASILLRVEQEPSKVVSWGGAFKSMAGLVAGFVLFIGIGSALYYFATNQNDVIPTVELSDNDALLLYGIEEEDILAEPAAITISGEDALAYVELYGYPNYSNE